MSKPEIIKNKMQKNTIQEHLLGLVKDVLPIHASLVDELAELLDVSTFSIYRRLRGETELSASEVAKICNHYKISFDKLINLSEDTVSFSFKTIHTYDDFKAFFERMQSDLTIINKSNEPLLTYAAFDIPLFHHFQYPLLTEFKLFSWMKSVLHFPEFENKLFETGQIEKDFTDTCKNIWHLYKQVKSREIWTEATIQSTIKQIEFHFEAGFFKDKKIAIELIDELAIELKSIEEMASQNSKLLTTSKDENFQLFISEIEIGNNCIQVDFGKEKAVYLSHNTFNTLTTFNHQFNNETDTWLTNLIKKSDMISGISQKRRYQFFNQAQNKLNALRQKFSN